MDSNFLSFELIDLSELTESGLNIMKHDGCGGSNGTCTDGCGCGKSNGNCGSAGSIME